MSVLRTLGGLLMLVVMPVLLLLNAASFALLDLAWQLVGRRRKPAVSGERDLHAVSVVIPTWNGGDLLDKYLPSIIAATRFHRDNEVIVVDNASQDGTAEIIRARFPEVRLLRMERNLGFGGGNNAGVAAARHDIVIVMNNDMRVEPDTFGHLLDGFRQSPDVFAVSAQIFFSDPNKRREETGLTEGSFQSGMFRVGHVTEDTEGLHPVFYAGGGSSAYDRKKFLELGGFHPLFHPFYLEDTDLSLAAWKHGWQVLYQPKAVVFHEHRGTIGKRFSRAQIDAVLQRNHLLMVWKNVHDWRWLASHWIFVWLGAMMSQLIGESPTRATPAGYWGALTHWGAALGARWQAHSMAVVGDREALSRCQAGYYRDRFLAQRSADPERPLEILFVSPYSIYPPTHGGGVFMYQVVKALSRRNHVHVLAFVDREEELTSNLHLEEYAASVECVFRDFQPRSDYLGLTPHAVRCFASDGFHRRVQRALFRHQPDILQLEYTQMAQYGGGLRHTPSVLFEHDVYFQSVWRRLKRERNAWDFATTLMEWLRAIRYEKRAVRHMDVVQTCSEEERRLLLSVVGSGAPIEAGLRAAIEASAYEPVFSGREPNTALFIGNFQHLPNQEALQFLVREVLPQLRSRRPEIELVVAGAGATQEIENLARAEGVRFLGRVEDIREPLSRYAVMLCPIFSGAGVRVKILEAFAAGIPVIATPLGAEGLDAADLRLASDAGQFVTATLAILDDSAAAEKMARHARRTLEEKWDWAVVVGRLERSYREALARTNV